MDQKMIDLYDEYSNEQLDRRGFIRKLAGLAGSTAAALALLPLIENSYAKAQIVAKDDPRLRPPQQLVTTERRHVGAVLHAFLHHGFTRHAKTRRVDQRTTAQIIQHEEG